MILLVYILKEGHGGEMAEIRNKIYLALYILHVSGEADAS